MTAMIELPFPLVGEPVRTVAQLDAMPVGSVFGHDSETSWYTKQADGTWRHADGESYISADLNVPCCGDQTVRELPILSRVELGELPVGSRVYWRREGRVYERHDITDGTGLHWIAADGSGDNRNDNMQGCVLTSRPREEFAVGSLVTTTQQAADCPAGVRLVLGRNANWPSDGTASFVKAPSDEHPDRPWVNANNTALRYMNNSFSGGEWRVAEVGVDLDAPPAAIYTQEQLDEAVAQASNEAAAAAGQNVNADWERAVERFSEAAKEFADEKDMCSQYDEFARQWPQFLKPRTKEFSVTLRITVDHTRTVTAMNEDEAFTLAREESGFYDGLNTSCYQEDVVVYDVDNAECEEVD